MAIERPANKPAHLCATPFCRKVKQKGRERCARCRAREFREKHPIAYLYNNTKHHARQRGIEFLLSKEEFRQFCEQTNYHLLKGRRGDAMTIDRRDSNGPYSIDNIQPLTHTENSTKRDDPDWNPPVSTSYTEDDNPLNS